MTEIEQRFPAFLRENEEKNPLRCEFYLPTVANAQIQEGTAKIHVLNTTETWYGVTYREDLASVQEAIAKMREEGKYPEILFA